MPEKKTCDNCAHCQKYSKICGDKPVVISICRVDGKGTFCLRVCDKWERRA